MESHDPHFKNNGIGYILADSFNKYLETNKEYFPFGVRPRGTLMILSDYGGQHKGSEFETFSFLVFDLEANQKWLEGQKQFRTKYMTDGRRMSFKSMNDNLRRRSLIPFLSLADSIDGWLVTFSVSKNLENLFEDQKYLAESSELLKLWKRRPAEKLLLILHFSAFLVSGLSLPYQNILWVCDQDDIAANVNQLTQLTKLFGIISSNFEGHKLGHLRCGTTQSDDGSLALEDLVSICDLSAGLFAEIISGLVGEGLFPRKGIISGMPSILSDKSHILTAWLSHDKASLRRINCVIDNGENGFARTTMIKTHAFAKPDLYPSIIRPRR